jgi:hypothetical protein
MRQLAMKELPPFYHQIGDIDLSKDTKLLFWLNIVGLILFICFGWLFWRFTIFQRPDFNNTHHPINFLIIVGIIIITLFVFIFHEILHGCFFWIFTQSRPKFGFKGAYAYAAAPEWYIHRNAYLVIGIAPLLLITLIGLILIPVIPNFYLIILIYALTLNASGSVGDIAVCLWLLRHPSSTLIQDYGDEIKIFHCED